jgi:cell division septation protein DedD
MLALRDQRQNAEPRIQVAQLPPGPVVRMDPIPDGSTTAAPVQLASAGPVVAMAPVASLGDFQRRMEPIESPGDRAITIGAVTRMDPVVSPGDPGTIQAEPLAPPAAAPVARGFSLVPRAQAATIPRPPAAAPASTPASRAGGAWGVQVGAFASQNLARDAAAQAQQRIGATGTRLAVEPVSQGRSTLYRARVVGLSSRGAADQACDRMRGRGACMIVAPGT